MLREMSAEELEGWKTFDTMEPIGAPGEWERAGSVSATFANVWRDKKVKSSPFAPEDFILRRALVRPVPNEVGARQEPLAGASKMLQFVEAMTLARGGRDIRRQRPVYPGSEKSRLDRPGGGKG
jgi:hypothetical protein